ncbi:Calcium homeostasis modulator protein 1 [Triplophysa tibetana]|uniref:Calcium homeostasis modulator protein 1 n=1 Tax=Triplophysa tibetana TaxID=1572043 RepID=A0A5A9P7L6_9TELE|nr:Calcium homeostasis modulator protein 1 [Triplophysa tibetana]
MDKVRVMLQFLQANQESFMNGICVIMALASAQMYSSFEFTCPCLPDYNYAYGIGILVIPPIWFFLLGFVINNNISVLTEEWKRPVGKRMKDPSVLRYMFSSMTQRALIAPIVWIAVTLMDGNSFLCAYSATTDLSQFLNESHDNLPKKALIRLQATIPCKDVFDGHKIISVDAATVYIRCLSQACGWIFLMVITLSAFLMRAIRPCFTQAAFLKTKYWSHYITIERKLFDETCKEHAKSFARVCIQQYFESISGEIVQQLHLPQKKGKGDKEEDGEKQKTVEEKLLGVRKEEDMNKVLWNWHSCKPPLNIGKRAQEANGHVHSDSSSFSDEYITRTSEKKTPVAYYSKV